MFRVLQKVIIRHRLKIKDKHYYKEGGVEIIFYIHYNAIVSCYIFKPVPDDGFLKKAETCSTFWTIKMLSQNTVVIDDTLLHLSLLTLPSRLSEITSLLQFY